MLIGLFEFFFVLEEGRCFQQLINEVLLLVETFTHAESESVRERELRHDNAANSDWIDLVFFGWDINLLILHLLHLNLLSLRHSFVFLGLGLGLCYRLTWFGSVIARGSGGTWLCRIIGVLVCTSHFKLIFKLN